MADKEKRIQKFLIRMRLKGKIKEVGTLEKAGIVIVTDPHSICDYLFFDKKGYQDALSRGETYPEDRVHFMVLTNPRNNNLILRGLLNKASSFMPFKN